MPAEAKASIMAGNPAARPVPELYPQWTAICMVAFHDLATCRSVGFDIGPIPWTAITAWAAEHGLRGETRRVFVTVIRRMDAAWLESERVRLAMEAKHKEPDHDR